MILFEILIWTFLVLFYLGGLIWSFKDWWNMDNILKTNKSSSDTDEDDYLGI